MAGPLDILLPPRLIIRAADDLHRMVGIAERVLERLDRLEERADRILTMGERIEGQADQVIDLGGRIGGQAKNINDLGGEIGELGRRLLEQGVLIELQADAVAARMAELVEALPTIEQAVSMVSPLEGAVERIGRAVDRLPGGIRRGAGETPEPIEPAATPPLSEG